MYRFRSNCHLLAAVICASVLQLVVTDTLPTCQPKDFHYEYTECDSYGGRWRVSVPSPATCIGGAPNPPIRGKECKFTCKPGSYLDINGDQQCKECPAGSYSLGGGVRFDSWATLPTGFSIKTEEFSGGATGFSETSKGSTNCSKTGWQPRGEFIASFADSCTASLVYSANLVKAGSVSFKYKYNDESTIFHFYVENDLCQTYTDRKSNVWPAMTEEGEWKTHRMNLKSGVNILYWKTIDINRDSEHNIKPVLIKEIMIDGVAFTSECTMCKGGTYSPKGASECSPCAVNTYSAKSAETCAPCDKNTQYAPIKSDKCLTRPACKAKDYFEYSTPCDSNIETQKYYKWIEPQICRTDLPGAAQLPTPGKKEKCPPCNPGMAANTTGSCVFCPSNQFSNGSVPCEECPVSTAPVYGIVYRWWNNIPQNVSTSCMSMDKSGCATTNGWIPTGDHITSGKGHADDAYLVLSLNVGGFKGNEGSFQGQAAEIAQLSFVFELNCTTKCAFFFIEDSPERGASVIQTWSGTQKKQKFTFPITKNRAATFNWAFQKTSWEEAFAMEKQSKLYTNDVAKIYAINVTNTDGGGAYECLPCPEGMTKTGHYTIKRFRCIPCPAGAYIQRNTTKCKKCPANTVIHGQRPFGIESCQKCGPGLLSKNHKSCYSDCKFVSPEGREYDFSPLSNAQIVTGAHLFTSSGTQYYHIFNISLCGKEMVQSNCYNNFTVGTQGPTTSQQALLRHLSGMKIQKSGSFNLLSSLHKQLIPSVSHISAFVCRSTIIPPKNPMAEQVLSAQPVSLGDLLVNISSHHNKTKDLMNERLKTAGWPIDEDDMDIHFTFNTEVPTAACSRGRSVIITMRCDVKEQGNGTIELPPKCPDGTCDGCNFHFLWKSRHACPQCKDEDYEEVKGECIKGEQTIYHYPPKHCVLSGTDNKPKKTTMKCSVLPMWVWIFLASLGGTGILMCLLIFYCWGKNKRLEYKYMKLVTASNTKDGELPAAETCALDEDEDDDQFDVKYKESKGKKLFNKLIAMAGKGDDNPFESIKLTDKAPL
ncbi:endosome/lysosome-associated apoptosis and autophagy regulator family member 2-like isoform X4 [Lineus longissimus]|uniref:endosome/lysosome-associated apoptosis and autophagy regulator family member 2-like isoform X4 n=1 Tax=Lineus longissimus TaxID=88925 RepID=UPI00315CBF8A